MMKKLSVMMMAVLMASVASAGVVVLNETTFDGTEPTSDGNLSGYADPGSTDEFDTVNGWTWGTDWTGASGGPGNGGVFDGLGTIQDQEIRVGTNLELQDGFFCLGFGGSPHQIALAQAFTLPDLTGVKVTVDAVALSGGVYLYIDDGSGTYTAQAVVIGNGANIYEFTPTSLNVRIAIRGNDGADSAESNGGIEYIKVESVPEPTTMALLGLGSLAMIRRKK